MCQKLKPCFKMYYITFFVFRLYSHSFLFNQFPFHFIYFFPLPLILDHLWQVEIDKHDLDCSQNLMGPFRVALSSKALTLIKMSPSSDFVYLEFPVSKLLFKLFSIYLLLFY